MSEQEFIYRENALKKRQLRAFNTDSGHLVLSFCVSDHVDRVDSASSILPTQIGTAVGQVNLTIASSKAEAKSDVPVVSSAGIYL